MPHHYGNPFPSKYVAYHSNELVRRTPDSEIFILDQGGGLGRHTFYLASRYSDKGHYSRLNIGKKVYVVHVEKDPELVRTVTEKACRLGLDNVLSFTAQDWSKIRRNPFKYDDPFTGHVEPFLHADICWRVISRIEDGLALAELLGHDISLMNENESQFIASLKHEKDSFCRRGEIRIDHDGIVQSRPNRYIDWADVRLMPKYRREFEIPQLGWLTFYNSEAAINLFEGSGISINKFEPIYERSGAAYSNCLFIALVASKGKSPEKGREELLIGFERNLEKRIEEMYEDEFQLNERVKSEADIDEDWEMAIVDEGRQALDVLDDIQRRYELKQISRWVGG